MSTPLRNKLRSLLIREAKGEILSVLESAFLSNMRQAAAAKAEEEVAEVVEETITDEDMFGDVGADELELLLDSIKEKPMVEKLGTRLGVAQAALLGEGVSVKDATIKGIKKGWSLGKIVATKLKEVSGEVDKHRRLAAGMVSREEEKDSRKKYITTVRRMSFEQKLEFVKLSLEERAKYIDKILEGEKT